MLLLEQGQRDLASVARLTVEPLGRFNRELIYIRSPNFAAEASIV